MKTGKSLVMVFLCLVTIISILTGCAPAPAAQTNAPAAPQSNAPAAAAPSAAPAEPAKPADPAKPAESKVDEIKIGVLIPLTGGQAATGENLKRSHELAAQMINEQGGIKSMGGAKIKLIFGDTQGDAAIGTNETERLITSEKVSALMGAFNSSVTFASTEVAERYKVPYLVPNSIMDEITERGFKYTFRMERIASGWSYDQIQFLKWLNEEVATPAGKPIKKLGFVFEDTDHGQSQSKAWRKYAQEAGFEVVLDQPYPSKSPDLTPVVMKVKNSGADVVIFVSYISDAILMFRTMSELQADVPAYLGSSAGYSDPSFIKEVGGLANYLFDLTEWTPDLNKDLSRKANQRFKETYGNNMNGAGAFCFSGTFVLADALERAASTDPEKIREALATTKITDGYATIIPWDTLEFDEKGQMQHTSMLVVQYQDGERRSVWPPEVAAVKPVFPQPAWADRK